MPQLNMAVLRLKIDVGGTRGDEAWNEIQQFQEIERASFGPQHGSSPNYERGAGVMHRDGEWCGAVVRFPADFVAQFAMPHYLEQKRVIDATIE